MSKPLYRSKKHKFKKVNFEVEFDFIFGILGSQNGRYCYCGNEYGKYGEGVCYARCVGDTSTICGGADSNTIYKTGLDGNLYLYLEYTIYKTGLDGNLYLYLEYNIYKTGLDGNLYLYLEYNIYKSVLDGNLYLYLE